MTELEQLAEVAVVAGANVQPGQILQVMGTVDQSDLVVAIADAAYRRGARFVDPIIRVPALQRSLIANGPAEAYVPAWADAPVYGIDEADGARIEIHGPPISGLLDDLDPVLVDRAQPPRRSAWHEVEYRVNNTIIPGPHPDWATTRYPDLDPDQALSALWRDVAIATRLDAPDPVAQWRQRFADLTERARQLTMRQFDALHLEGPGTDLEVGLLPGVRWEGPTNVSHRGVLHAWNVPSEEIYTSPDPRRVNGHVRLTRPAVVGGALAHDIVLTFRDGNVVQIDGAAERNRLQAFAERDAGARRVGELAIVDADSAVARVREPFGMVLLDENAASHIALGFAFPELADDQTREQLNASGEHLDLTIGEPELQISGFHDHDGRPATPLIRDGRWLLSSPRRLPDLDDPTAQEDRV